MRACASKIVARRAAGPHLGFTGEKGLLRDMVVGPMSRPRLPDDHGAHDGCVVPPIDTGELQGDLVLLVEDSTARLVAAQQCIGP